jgi:hypothetical protein
MVWVRTGLANAVCDALVGAARQRHEFAARQMRRNEPQRTL